MLVAVTVAIVIYYLLYDIPSYFSIVCTVCIYSGIRLSRVVNLAQLYVSCIIILYKQYILGTYRPC